MKLLISLFLLAIAMLGFDIMAAPAISSGIIGLQPKNIKSSARAVPVDTSNKEAGMRYINSLNATNLTQNHYSDYVMDYSWTGTSPNRYAQYSSGPTETLVIYSISSLDSRSSPDCQSEYAQVRQIVTVKPSLSIMKGTEGGQGSRQMYDGPFKVYTGRTGVVGSFTFITNYPHAIDFGVFIVDKLIEQVHSCLRIKSWVFERVLTPGAGVPTDILDL